MYLQSVRKLFLAAVLALAGCGSPSGSDGGSGGGTGGSGGAGGAGGSGGAGGGGGGTGGGGDAYVVPTVLTAKSLFWNDAVYLDDAQVISFSKLMAAASSDNHGGRLLERWFYRFGTTVHSERLLPAQFIDQVKLAQGNDPAQWNLSLLPFKVTGIHNRIDLMKLGAGGHCGEFRASAASTDVTLQPFHALFIFQQPAGAGDTDASGAVHCLATARAWADLSRLDASNLSTALKAAFARALAADRFALAETVEFTLSPWEWRQWVKGPDGTGALPYVLENPPLFQQVDVEGLNVAGARRDGFLSWVEANAAAIDARTMPIPDTYRAQSVRVIQGVPRTPISLAGLNATVAAQYPELRQKLELVGCAACHTADADFVQTRPDRTVSKFYEKELLARERHLEKLAGGLRPTAPFGPLQENPVLPP
jgi:hypothetical protein